MGALLFTWKYPRREGGIHWTPKTNKPNRDITKRTSVRTSNNQIQIWNNVKNHKTSRKNRSATQKEKKGNIFVEQSSLSQIELRMIEPNDFFCMKLDFSTLSSDVSWQNSRCKIASILKQKAFHSNGEMLCSDGVSLFLHQCQKILPALFCWFWAEITPFSQKKQTVNFKSPQKSYNHVASAVPRRLTAVSAEIPAILEN